MQIFPWTENKEVFSFQYVICVRGAPSFDPKI